MKLTYAKLWKLLIDKKMNKTKLRELSGISTTSLAKLNSGRNINTDTLLRICEALDCDICDIMELERETE